MITQFRLFILNPSSAGIILIALLFNIVTAFLIRMPSQTPVVIHYTILSGIEEVGDASALFYIPVLVLLLFGINLSLSFYFFSRDKLLSKLFILSGMILEILFFFGVLALRSINGY